jgi:hypothetical protein
MWLSTPSLYHSTHAHTHHSYVYIEHMDAWSEVCLYVHCIYEVIYLSVSTHIILLWAVYFVSTVPYCYHHAFLTTNHDCIYVHPYHECSSLYIPRILGACHCQTMHLSWLQLSCNLHDHQSITWQSLPVIIFNLTLILFNPIFSSTKSIYLIVCWSTIRLTAIDRPYPLSWINQPILSIHVLRLSLTSYRSIDCTWRFRDLP